MMHSVYKLYKQGDNIQPWCRQKSVYPSTQKPTHVFPSHSQCDSWALFWEKNLSCDLDHYYPYILPLFFSYFIRICFWLRDFTLAGCSVGKESTCNAGDLGLIPGLGRSPGEGKGYLLQYSCLENSIDCIAHGVTKGWTRLSNFHYWKHFFPQITTWLTPFCSCYAKSLQSCLTLCDPIDGSPPGSPVPGILQARTLEWVAISFSNA